MGRKKRTTASSHPKGDVDTPFSGEFEPRKVSSTGHEQRPMRKSEEKLKINKHFAERYEASKRKQFLSNVPAALLADSSGSDSSSEEDEDEFAEQLTKGIDRRVRETLEAIRKKDPRIYDKDTRFFDEEKDDDEEGGDDKDDEDDDNADEIDYDSEKEPVAGWETIAESAKADIAKITLKDYVRETLLKDGKLSDSDDEDEISKGERRFENGERNPNRDDEDAGQARSAKNTILAPSANDENGSGGNISDDDSDEGDFFQKKDKSQADIEAEEKDFEMFLRKQTKKSSQKAGEELLLHSYLENEKPDEKEQFLRDFVLNNGWLDKNSADAPAADDYEIEVDRNDPNKTSQDNSEAGEDEFEDRVDEFEAKYNFRFEDPDGARIVSHSRTVADSMRRPDNRRKAAREARRLRKQQEKLAKTEEIKHLKNLKKKELETRLLAIQEAAGDGMNLSGIDLDGDFDPEEFNRQMESKFGDEYYSQKDDDMKQLTKEGVAVASERRLPTKKASELPEDMREGVNKVMDEYYNLDYEDIVGGVPMRFNYKKVEPQSFNMTAEEILSMEDKELNRIVSLKYLAPYRANRDVKKQSWRVHDALKKQRRAKRENSENGQELSALQELAKSHEKNQDPNDSWSRARRKVSDSGKRKRSHSHQDIPEENHTGTSSTKADSVEEPQHAYESSNRQQGEEQQKMWKKRKRKKRSKTEAVEGMSTSRRAAYSME